MKTEEIVAIEKELTTLKEKQQVLDKAWRKTGDRNLIQFFIDILPKQLNVERCSIFVLDPKTDEVWLHCGSALAERDIKVPKSRSMVGEAIAGGKYLIRTDMAASTGTHHAIDMITGFTTFDALCVPISSRDGKQVIGAIQVLNKRRRAEYSEENISLMQRLATLIQKNIESVYLRQAIVRVSEQLKTKIKKLERALVKYGVKKTSQQASSEDKASIHLLQDEISTSLRF